MTGPAVSTRRLLRLSMGVRLFLILLVVLLPLALIAMLATQRIAETAAEDRARLLQTSVDDAGKRLQNELRTDLAILSAAASQIALGEDAALVCGALAEAFGPHGSRFSALLYADRSGEPACQLGPDAPILSAPATTASGPAATLLPQSGGALMRVQGRVSGAAAVAHYSAASLLAMADPLDEIPVSQFELRGPSGALPLTEVPAPWDRKLNAAMQARQPINGLYLNLRYARAPRSPPEFLAQIVPLLTVLAAAIVGWAVVSRMLVSPIVLLRRKLKGYQPGEALPAMRRSRLAAREIDDLDGAVVGLAERVALDKQALDEALTQQKALTREVHHRVKNNLQIIASLISLHARTAETSEAQAAYAKIQRRVDALAVVHRNHFAASETREGINLRALVNELTGSFQNGDEAPGAIHIAIDNVRIDQDVGVPVASLLTEILELIRIDQPDAPVSIRVEAGPADQAVARASMVIESPALRSNPVLEARLSEGIDRIMAGLARQLRARLEQDRSAGTIRFDLPVFQPPA